MSGGVNNTSRKRASRSTASSPSISGGRHRRSPGQVARDVAVARMVKPLVGWTQRESLRRLAFALRPLIDQGQEAHDIAVELQSWWLTWRPANPAAYITARLRRKAGEPIVEFLSDGDQGDRGTDAETAWAEACARLRQQVALDAAAANNDVQCASALKQQRQLADAPLHLETLAPVRVWTDADRAQAKRAAHYDPQTVLDHCDDHGLDDAFDLYGADLVALIHRLHGRGITYGRAW